MNRHRGQSFVLRSASVVRRGIRQATPQSGYDVSWVDIDNACVILGRALCRHLDQYLSASLSWTPWVVVRATNKNSHGYFVGNGIELHITRPLLAEALNGHTQPLVTTLVGLFVHECTHLLQMMRGAEFKNDRKMPSAAYLALPTEVDAYAAQQAAMLLVSRRALTAAMRTDAIFAEYRQHFGSTSHIWKRLVRKVASNIAGARA